jgi:hypothetical protein
MPRIARKGSAEFIAALHRIDLADAPSSCWEPPADHDARTRAAIEESRGLIDTEAATAGWDAALRAPEWPGRLGSRGPEDARRRRVSSTNVSHKRPGVAHDEPSACRQAAISY